jgi:hypothetical protein
MPEAWELRKKAYPTPANASTQERFRARDSMPRCQNRKSAVRLFGFRRVWPLRHIRCTLRKSIWATNLKHFQAARRYN